MSGVRSKQLLWRRRATGRRCYRLHLQRTKTVLEGAGVDINVGDYDSPYSSVKLLKRWVETNHLGERPEAYIFPRVTRSGAIDWTKPATTDWLRKMIKRRVASIGLDPKRYSGHSLRAGGATDLFMQRLPFYLIKKAGRWASDAAMIYYRADEDVLEAVAAAFSSQAALA